LTSSRALKKFLSPEQIEGALVEVAKMASDSRSDIALIGGVALQLYGSDRLTKDVDFVADVPFNGLTDVVEIKIGGYQGKTPSGIPVDVLIGGKYAELREASLRSAISEPELGVAVVRLPYIMALKLVAGRAKDEEDIRTMLRLDVVDVEDTLAVIKRYVGEYAADDFRSVVEEAEWKRDRDRKRDK